MHKRRDKIAVFFYQNLKNDIFLLYYIILLYLMDVDPDVQTEYVVLYVRTA